MGTLGTLVAACKRGGPAPLLATVTNGVRWRLRRLRRFGRRLRVAWRQTITPPVAPAPPVQPRMTSDQSISAAIARLGELDFRPEVLEEVAMSAQPAIAVIVPTYGDARFLSDALASVRQQTYPHWRCIVVDDASPDAVWPIVEPLAQADSRFVYLRHGRNAGLAAARNTALRMVDETYVQFLDADDMLTPRCWPTV